MSLGSVGFVDANGDTVQIAVVAVGGFSAAAHVLVDGGGTPFSAANPLLTAPGILAADFVSRSGSITIANAPALAIAANPARKGGEIRAPQANAGLIVLTITKADGVTSFVKTLEAGAAYSLTINPGYVLQQAIAVSGTVVGDTFEGVEFV